MTILTRTGRALRALGAGCLLLSLAALPAQSAFAETAEEFYESGVALHAEGELLGAIIQLKNALQQNPDHLPARVMLGRLHLENNEPLDAENQLKTALELGADPDLVVPILGLAWLYQGKHEEIMADQRYRRFSTRSKAEWRLLRGKVQLSTGRPARAEEEFQEALDLWPESIEGLTGLAYSYLVRGDTQRGQQIANAAELVDSEHHLVLKLQGELATARGDEDAALDYYSRAIAVNPQNFPARQRRAAILLSRGEYAASEQDIDFVLETFPNNPRAMVTKAILMTEQKRNREAQLMLEEFNFKLSNVPDDVLDENIDLKIIRGLTLYLQGSSVQAIPYLEEIYEAHPEKDYVRHMLVESYFNNRNFDEIISLYADIEKLPQGEMNFVYLYARASLFAQRQQDVEGKLRQWAENDPDRRNELSQLLAVVLTTKGDHEAALAAMEGIDLDSVKNLNSLLLLGTVQLEQGLVDAAEETSQTLNRRFPGHPRALNLSCLVKKRRGKLDDALKDCIAASAADGQYVAPVLNGSLIYLEQGEYERAISGFNAVLLVRPADARALSGMAHIASERREWTYAIRFGERLAAFYPNNLDYRFQLAGYYLQAGRVTEAIEQLDYAERVDPGNPRGLAMRASANRLMGEETAAAEQLRELYRRYRTERPEALPDIAREQLSMAMLEDAEVTIREILKHPEYREQGLQIQGEYYLSNDEPEQCVRVLRSRRSKDAESRLLLARCLAATGRGGEALAELNQLLADDPSEINAVQRPPQLIGNDIALVLEYVIPRIKAKTK